MARAGAVRESVQPGVSAAAAPLSASSASVCCFAFRLATCSRPAKRCSESCRSGFPQSLPPSRSRNRNRAPLALSSVLWTSLPLDSAWVLVRYPAMRTLAISVHFELGSSETHLLLD
eukprot:231661-Rhodomonas_salina.1